MIPRPLRVSPGGRLHTGGREELPMKPILIVKTGEPLPALGTFESWITRGLGIPVAETRVAAVFRDEPLPEPEALRAAVITGASAMVTDHEPWSERTASWLRRAAAVDLPMLGICFGHQLLAHALGGVVGDNPAGREIGTITVHRLPESDTDPLFSVLRRDLTVQATHVQSVLELPPETVRLAESPMDPHHAFRFGDHVWGVQFHPELDAALIRAFIEDRAGILRAEGLDPEALARNTRDSDDGHALLRRFAEIVTGA